MVSDVSEWVQENQRAVVMLAVAMCVAVLAGLYVVLSGGDSAEDLPPVARSAPAETVTEDIAAEEAVVEVRPAVRVYSGRGTSANPFGPIEGGKNDTDSDPAAKPAPKPSSTTPAPRKDPGATTTRRDPASSNSTSNKPATSDPAPKPVDKPDPAPIAPQLIEQGKDSDASVLVNVVQIDADSLVARVEGQRSRLFVNEPGDEGVIYVAPLGGGCAWIGRTGSDVRVSVCKGTPERV